MQQDNKERIDFYDAHKDKSFDFPILPDDIQPWDGVNVTKWFIDQMLNNNVGWLNLAVRTVNDPGYEHLPQHFTGRIECDKIINHYGYKETNLNVSSHWTKARETAPASKEWWHKCFPSEQYNFIKYNFIKPLQGIGPRIDRDPKGTTPFEVLDHGLPVHLAMKRPGHDCKLVVEDCGIVPMNEGSMYLLNPNKRYAYINTSKDQDVHTHIASVTLGDQFTRFCDLIARSYDIQKGLQT
jgi:hypothetical protein